MSNANFQPVDDAVVYYCTYCGGEIYKGDDCYEFSVDDAFNSIRVHICKDCMQNARIVAGED